MNFNNIENKWESNSEESFEDEIKFKPSIKAYEHVGLSAAVSAMLGTIMEGNLGELQKKINKMIQNPVDRFAIYVDAISRSLTSREIINLTQDDIINMLLPIKNIKNIEHKNPTAYILGYVATEGGISLNKKNIQKVFKILSSLEDYSIKEPDVIRYSRFWMTLK
jgi:hypothetical protein